MAMAIGADADREVLGKFVEGTKNPLFSAKNAKELCDFFKFVTMSVTIRTQSKDKNVVPEASAIEAKPATIEERAERLEKPIPPKNAGDLASREDSDGGYW